MQDDVAGVICQALPWAPSTPRTLSLRPVIMASHSFPFQLNLSNFELIGGLTDGGRRGDAAPVELKQGHCKGAPCQGSLFTRSLFSST